MDVARTVAAAERSEAAPEGGYGGPRNVNRFVTIGQSESSMSLKINFFLGGSNFRETPVN